MNPEGKDHRHDDYANASGAGVIALLAVAALALFIFTFIGCDLESLGNDLDSIRRDMCIEQFSDAVAEYAECIEPY